MQSLEIIAPGVHTTIQDAGRIGFRDVGVPTSGPLDRIAFRLANALVGNPPDTPVLVPYDRYDRMVRDLHAVGMRNVRGGPLRKRSAG